MSWRIYNVLSMQPDFTENPVVGLVDGSRIMIELGQAEAFGYWRGDTPIALGFTYRISSPAELRQFREFLNVIGGKSTPFFCPSWSADFTLTAPASIGDTTIRVAAAGFSSIVENRPDTPGRQIFLLTSDNQFQSFGVTNAELDGDEEILQLDAELAYNFDPEFTLCGRLYLVRLAEDRVEYEFQLPGRGTAPLKMVSTRQTRRVNERKLVDGTPTFNLKAFSDVIATDENPLKYRFDSPTSAGPLVYGSSSSNYANEWLGSWDAGLKIVSPLGVEITTGLFTDVSRPAHWTFAFDATGKEFVAWATNEGTIRLGFFEGIDESHLEFEGFAPQAFNTYEIDSTKNAGESDAVIFYLRPGFSGLFARFYREDFATEHLIARSPVAPIYLQAARANGAKIEVVGMDAGHRLAIWRAGDYIPPLEVQTIFGSVDEATGLYRAITIMVGEPENLTAKIDELVGIYKSIRVEATARLPGGIGALDSSMSGLYKETRILVDPPNDALSGGLDSSISGAYTLKAKGATAPDSVTASIDTSLTGTYAP